MGKLLFLLFTVVPLVEIYLLIGLGGRVGVWPTLALVLVTGAVGAALAKREGLRVLREYQRTLSEGRMPEEGVLGAVLVLVGGVLLVAPGMLTDVAGILLLVPPTRRLAARWLRRRLERGVRDGSVQFSAVGLGGLGGRSGGPGRGGPRAAPSVRPRPEDISDAEVVDDE